MESPRESLPEESLVDLYDDAPCGYISALEDGTIVRANDTFLGWMGYTRDEIVGLKRIQELLTPGGRIFHETHYAPMLRMQGFVREIAVEFIRADGTLMPALINSKRSELDDGRVVVRTTVFDATERRLYEEELLRERTRARESEARARLLAETLQASLVPPEPSQIPGLDVAAAYRPAGTGEVIGGDFYDVFETKRGDWIVTMGDVSGKGPEAARVTAAARYTIRAAATQSSRPTVLLGAVNDALLANNEIRHCTMVCARFTRSGNEIHASFASGGHPLPLVWHQGSLATVGVSGTLLGAFEHIDIEETRMVMSPGDIVLLYTDGVTEGRSPEGSFYGEERLVQVIAGHDDKTAPDLVDEILRDVVGFQAGSPRDDIAILAIRWP